MLLPCISGSSQPKLIDKASFVFSFNYCWLDKLENDLRMLA